MRGSLAAIVGVFVVANLPPAFADSGSLDCDALQRKALALNPAPNLQIAPAEAHFAIPAAYFEGYQTVAGEGRLVSSGRLTSSIFDFSAVDPKYNPLHFGKGWGDTVTISIEQVGVAKSGKDLLKYFLSQKLLPLKNSDSIGFNVFKLENGLDLADEMHISPDKKRFFLCSTIPSNSYKIYNICETMINPFPQLNMKITLSVGHIDQFPSVIDKAGSFVSCFLSDRNKK